LPLYCAIGAAALSREIQLLGFKRQRWSEPPAHARLEAIGGGDMKE
jgi:hypothetical protein